PKLRISLRRAAGAEHGLADQAHSIADIGRDGVTERSWVLRHDGADRGLMLIVERRLAEPLVDNAHEWAELQPQGFNELRHRAARLRMIECEMKGVVIAHIGFAVANRDRAIERGVDITQILQPRSVNVRQRLYGGFGFKQQATAQEIVKTLWRHRWDLY